MKFMPPGVLFANALNISQKNNVYVVHFAKHKKSTQNRVLFCYFLIIQLNKKQQNQCYEKRDADRQHNLVSYNFLHYKKSVGFLKTPANVENFLIGCH
jgi:hypothetical protein